MNERLKAVRATLEQAHGALSRLDTGVGSAMRDVHTRAALDNLTNALDVLTGEVERLERCAQSSLKTQEGLFELMKIIQKTIF